MRRAHHDGQRFSTNTSRLTTRPIDAVELRGRQQPLMVHELLPLARGD